MKRPDDSQVKAAGATGCPDELWGKKYPKIVEYMVTVAWEGGGTRQASSVAVTVADGLVQVALNDKELKQSFYTQAGSVGEALALLEKALVSGVDGWRSWKSGRKK